MSGLTPLQEWTEEYIRGLKWVDASDEVRTLVAGNIRAYAAALVRELFDPVLIPAAEAQATCEHEDGFYGRAAARLTKELDEERRLRAQLSEDSQRHLDSAAQYRAIAEDLGRKLDERSARLGALDAELVGLEHTAAREGFMVSREYIRRLRALCCGEPDVSADAAAPPVSGASEGGATRSAG